MGRTLASQWLTTVVVTDLVVSFVHQGREAAQSLAATAEGGAGTGWRYDTQNKLDEKPPSTGIAAPVT